jgi:hypothetical protein
VADLSFDWQWDIILIGYESIGCCVGESVFDCIEVLLPTGNFILLTTFRLERRHVTCDLILMPMFFLFPIALVLQYELSCRLDILHNIT